LQTNDDYKLLISVLQNMVSPSAALIQFVAKNHTRNHLKKNQ